jgi:hypothetical protein
MTENLVYAAHDFGIICSSYNEIIFCIARYITSQTVTSWGDFYFVTAMVYHFSRFPY